MPGSRSPAASVELEEPASCLGSCAPLAWAAAEIGCYLC